MHGVCGFDGIDRTSTTGLVEALNEERFFLSEVYMTMPQVIRIQEDDDGSRYRLRTWQTLINAHIPPAILKSIRHGSVSQCLKQRYLHCPLIKLRPHRPFADLHVYLCTDKDEGTDATVHVAATVYGKQICNVCGPSNVQANCDTAPDSFIQLMDTEVEFEEFFRRLPIRFHRDRLALR